MNNQSGLATTFLSVDELAARYGVSPSTVHQWLYKGKAPRSLKIGRYRRFRLDDVVAWEETLIEAEPQNPAGSARPQ